MFKDLLDLRNQTEPIMRENHVSSIRVRFGYIDKGPTSHVFEIQSADEYFAEICKRVAGTVKTVEKITSMEIEVRCKPGPRANAYHRLTIGDPE